jgi:hypothetical protein
VRADGADAAAMSASRRPAAAGFGEVLTRKYIVTISWFSMLSLFLKGTRTPLETTDKIVSYIGPPS